MKTEDRGVEIRRLEEERIEKRKLEEERDVLEYLSRSAASSRAMALDMRWPVEQVARVCERLWGKSLVSKHGDVFVRIWQIRAAGMEVVMKGEG